jgi:DNA-binding transcriptional ArsR family regulator
MSNTKMSEEEKLARENTSNTVKIVSDPEKIKILVDPMRRKILRTMRQGIENEDGTIRKEMTVPEIARSLGVTAPKCYHHLDLLVENGFVRVAREEKKTRTSITYYVRTSPAFVLASTIDEIEREEGIKRDPLIAIINNGFKLGLSKKEMDEAQKLIEEYISRTHDVFIKVAKQLKGNLPEDRTGEVLRFVGDLQTVRDERSEEIRKELSKYIKIDI